MAPLTPPLRSFHTTLHTLHLSLMNDIETPSSKGLVAQWKRIRLRIWGLQVRSLPSSSFYWLDYFTLIPFNFYNLYILLYIYFFIYIYIYIYFFIYLFIYIFIYISMYVFISIFLYFYISIFLYSFIPLFLYSFI